MADRRWLRIIPVAFIMYTIAFVDRTNISLALPDIARDLHMNPEQSGNAAGIFFWGYIVLQIPGGYLAEHWSAKRFVAVLLVVWGVCASAAGLVRVGVPAALGGPGGIPLIRDPADPSALSAASPVGSGGQAVVSLNTATEAELEQLPGIGPGLAHAILADRAAHGPFRSAADLARVKGIGAATVRRLEGRIVVP